MKMQPPKQQSLRQSKSFVLGVILLYFALLMWGALSLTTAGVAHERALTTADKNQWIAALTMLFGVPLLIFGAGAFGMLLLSVISFLWRRFDQQKNG